MRPRRRIPAVAIVAAFFGVAFGGLPGLLLAVVLTGLVWVGYGRVRQVGPRRLGCLCWNTCDACLRDLAVRDSRRSR